MSNGMQIANGLTVYRKVLLWACVACIVASVGCRWRAKIETTVGMDSPEQTWIRVLLFGNLRRCTVASVNGFVVEDQQTGVVAEFDTDKPLGVFLLGERILIGEHIFGHDVTIKPRQPYVFTIDREAFRGNLQLLLRSDRNGLEVINHVPVESYLLGVVGAEMHSYWEPEALKAQAVAARTYSLFIKNRFGNNRSWDLSRTQSSQVYKGVKAETATVEKAVKDTAGKVLVCSYPDGQELIFPTYYSSSCGGHTENAGEVFGDTVDPLCGVVCPFCRNIAKQSNFNWKPVTFTTAQISEKLMERYDSLKKLEAIVDVKVIRKGYLGRITRVQLIGKNSSKDWLRGEDFRLSLDPSGRKLKSSLCTMTKDGPKFLFSKGHGFGHGVGLCQCGAQGMARNGADYRKILRYYYPGSKQVTIETAKP